MYWETRQEFDRRASARSAWGMGLTAVAAVLLVWLGRLLLVPFGVTSDGGREIDCGAPVSETYSPDSPSVCAGERQWPELVGVLGLSVPFAVTGAALWVSGSSRRRTAEHVLRVLELQESGERSGRERS
ncbi:hypothetical protein OG599_14050 [Streptomyces sp. NBC_01335]|uniref:hypothetical protein n=1 Tax=Streptomyces sp. NBC_01335 TaxID=2903828 RepID=UPI002E115CFC|nr:hypothetical protein OG599_14050 [Streptomyces sp. NBC_01335]